MLMVNNSVALAQSSLTLQRRARKNVVAWPEVNEVHSYRTLSDWNHGLEYGFWVNCPYLPYQ
jgi:hypothetical protein